jgi:hypothetical protein
MQGEVHLKSGLREARSVRLRGLQRKEVEMRSGTYQVLKETVGIRSRRCEKTIGGYYDLAQAHLGLEGVEKISRGGS